MHLLIFGTNNHTILACIKVLGTGLILAVALELQTYSGNEKKKNCSQFSVCSMQKIPQTTTASIQ